MPSMSAQVKVRGKVELVDCQDAVAFALFCPMSVAES
jgi:hypothetical protein